MFQCPNCRAYTDLSAEVDDSNDFETDSKNDAVSDDKQGPADEVQSTTSSPHLGTSRTSSDSRIEDRETPELPADGLADNMEAMGLPDGSPAEMAPVASVTSAPNPECDVPGWQSLTQVQTAVPPRQAQLRLDSPMRSESSDENPLTPRNDSGPLAFDGRAGMT